MSQREQLNTESPQSQSDEDVVLLTRTEHILVITLNRPQARNAINAQVSTALAAALEMLNDDHDLRVGILTGAGSAFCAGQDLKAFAAGEPVIPRDNPQWGFAGFVRHFTAKPLIAALNGLAYGGGLELALSCDLIVASDTARLALPEVTRGLFAAGGGVPRIAQQLPAKIAARLVLTGEPITAAEAARWGLVNEVVPADALADTALALAQTIAQNAPLAVQASKRVLAAATAQSTWGDAPWGLIDEQFKLVFASEDAEEGGRSFAEKRPPVWVGR